MKYYNGKDLKWGPGSHLAAIAAFTLIVPLIACGSLEKSKESVVETTSNQRTTEQEQPSDGPKGPGGKPDSDTPYSECSANAAALLSCAGPPTVRLPTYGLKYSLNFSTGDISIKANSCTGLLLNLSAFTLGARRD